MKISKANNKAIIILKGELTHSAVIKTTIINKIKLVIKSYNEEGIDA